MAGEAGWGNLNSLHGQIETSGAPNGQKFLRIPVGNDQTPVRYFDYYEPVFHRDIRPLAASKGWIKIAGGAPYTLSCFMRASREGVPAVLGVVARAATGGDKEHRQQVKLTTQWKRYSLTFTPEQPYAFVFAGPDLRSEERVDVDVDAIQLEKGQAPTEFQPRRPVELALDPAEEAGIFYDDQPAVLSLGVCNTGDAPCHLNVKFQVTDFEDKQVVLPDCGVDVPPQATVCQKVTLPGEWRGFYHVAASAQTGGATLAASLRIAIVPRRTGVDSVLGINHAFGSADLIRLASKAGVGWYRDWTLRWQNIEPAKGEFHWQVGDTQIDRVLREGHPVLPLLPPFPSANWSSEGPTNISSTGYPGSRMRQAWAPKDPRELADFISQTVTHYKDRIHIWEFLNEPIYTDYSLPRSSSRAGAKTYKPDDYVALLATASAAMRKADPSCKVIGGIAGEPRTLTQEVLDDGILKYVDYFNLHIYPNMRAPEAYAPEMDALLRNMDAHGGRKPIWITEFSYYGADNLPRRPYVSQPGDGVGEGLMDSERECADYTARFLAVVLSHGAQRVFIHSGSSSRVNNPNFQCELFDYGGVPRKVFPAVAVLTQVLGPAPKCVGTRSIGLAGHVAAFESGKQAVLVLWQSEGERAPALRLPSGADLLWMDAMGRKSSTPPAKLSSSLAYLLANSGSAADLLQRIPQ